MRAAAMIAVFAATLLLLESPGATAGPAAGKINPQLTSKLLELISKVGSRQLCACIILMEIRPLSWDLSSVCSDWRLGCLKGGLLDPEGFSDLRPSLRPSPDLALRLVICNSRPQ